VYRLPGSTGCGIGHGWSCIITCYVTAVIRRHPFVCAIHRCASAYIGVYVCARVCVLRERTCRCVLRERACVFVRCVYTLAVTVRQGDVCARVCMYVCMYACAGVFNCVIQ
jgi:hypothetical protein